jgi:hypothetical protein
MAKRRKDQSLNHLAGALKKIMTCGGAKGPFNSQQMAIMLKAAILLGMIDKIFSAEQITAVDAGSLPTATTDDAVLAELRTKFQGGVKNESTSS